MMAVIGNKVLARPLHAIGFYWLVARNPLQRSVKKQQ